MVGSVVFAFILWLSFLLFDASCMDTLAILLVELFHFIDANLHVFKYPVYRPSFTADRSVDFFAGLISDGVIWT